MSVRRFSVPLCLVVFIFCLAVVMPGRACAQTGPFAPVLEPPVVSQNFTAIAPGVSTPPDTNGAVGPNHLLVATNGTVRIQDRSGAILSTVSLGAFWSGMGITDAFDPRSYFDPYSQRFIIITCAERRSPASGMLLAVSATDDPTGVWHRWLLDADPSNINWVDYGNLGFTADAITFSGNMFSIAADAFNGVRFWRVDRASLISGGPLVMDDMQVTGVGGTLVPVSTYDAVESTQYVIRAGTSNLFGTGRVQLYRLSGPMGAPVLTVSAFAALGSPWSITLPNAPQLGTAATIETNDDRILSAIYRNGRIWCTHTVGMPALGAVRTGAKWWEVYPATGQSRQDGVLEDPAGGSLYYPSLVVNSQGLTLIGCSGSSSTEYVGTFYAWRNPDSPLGTMDGLQRYHAGAGPYSGPRWGDYSGTYLDPVDGTSIWVLQQYAEVANRWGIQWAQLTVNQSNALSAGGKGLLLGLALALAVVSVIALRRVVRIPRAS